MRDRAAAVALSALVVVALVTVVAVASTGSTPGGTNASRPPSEALYDAFFTLLLVAAALGGVLLVYGLTQRKAIALEVASGRYRRTGVVSFLVVFGLFGAVTYWRLLEWDGPPAPEEEGEFAFPGQTELLPTLPEGAETSYEPSVSWVPLLVVAGLLIAAAVAFVIAERRSSGGDPWRSTLARLLADVLDESLDDLRAEKDPRKAIIASYARLERVLAANGAPRLASETADEYLPRVLHDLELDPAAVVRLTDLFREAKFSQHEMGVALKDEAIGALEQVRDELRSLREAPLAHARDASTPAEAAP